MVAMADALCREYGLGMLPTQLLGLDLAPSTEILVNARILSKRNEEARVHAMAESEGGGSKITPSQKAAAKRKRLEAQRAAMLRKKGVNN